jgi:uncharacterized protein YceH (UPF0502 family)
VLLEKEVTTPDQYPLSLNGLTMGCNQKSSREPIMSLTESQVQNVLDELRDKKLIFEYTSVGSRVVKYKHRFCNTEFSDLKFSRQQLAVICVLLLRGPQSPGELRTRTARMAEFSNVQDVEDTLNKLQDLNAEQLVVKLNREPGKRDARYAHLFCGEQGLQMTTEASAAEQVNQTGLQTSVGQDELTGRVTQLEKQVADLSGQLSELKELVDMLID